MPNHPPRFCALRPRPPRVAPAGLSHTRVHAMLVGDTKWVNQTVLHYYFFDRASDEAVESLEDGTTATYPYVGAPAQQQAVRDAFQEWAAVGIGIKFVEVPDRSEAELRIGFAQDNQSFTCAIGRNILEEKNPNRVTTNFGWDLTAQGGHATALHEIGHMLGLGHEHQNPYAGIVWDDDAVYAYCTRTQHWSRQETLTNVLEKVEPAEAEGSKWDPTSIMEYAFPQGLIKEPPTYFTAGLTPPGTLSAVDEAWARQWYPLPDGTPPPLAPLTTEPLSLKEGEQSDYTLEPPGTKRYTAQTVGDADCVLVLFEDVEGQLRYIAGDDDGGTDRNAQISERLVQGRTYVLRVRVNWIGASGMAGVMYC